MSTFFFMLELSSLASFCSRASVLLALHKFDLALKIAIIRTSSLRKSHMTYYFIYENFIFDPACENLYTDVKLLSVRPQFFICELKVMYNEQSH